MTYGEAKLWLPNQEMASYFVQTLHIEFQARPVNRRGTAFERAPQKTTSERFTCQHEPEWLRANPTREEPTHTSYDD
jgi:hypothetical protein